MPRYLKIRGVPHVNVPDPRAGLNGAGHALPFRFLGKQMRPDAQERAQKGAPITEWYDLADQVVQDEVGQHVRRACKAGELVLVGECTAPDFAAALVLLNPKPAPVPPAPPPAPPADDKPAKAKADK